MSYPGKRLLDIIVALIMLAASCPLLAIVGLFVRLSLGCPVLFRQVRPGYRGRPFKIFKFRTMKETRGVDGCLLPDSDRLTRLGKWLRATSIDELPELLNVLRGEMSIVGPRPLLFRYMPYFTHEERTRFKARPGITGLAQTSGRNMLGWDERLALDAEYVRTMSLGRDLRIIANTALDVLFIRGVSADVDLVETWLDEEREEIRLQNSGSLNNIVTEDKEVH